MRQEEKHPSCLPPHACSSHRESWESNSRSPVGGALREEILACPQGCQHSIPGRGCLHLADGKAGKKEGRRADQAWQEAVIWTTSRSSRG